MGRDSASVKAIRRFSKEGATTPEEVQSLLEAIRDESDRTVGVLLGSLLESTIKDALLRRMKVTRDEERELFEGSAPLATFSAKTKLASALGVFGQRVFLNIDYIREIRNAFAHSRKHAEFSSKPIKDVCNLLNYPSHTLEGISNPRDRYHLSCSSIAVAIITADHQGITAEERHVALP